MRKVRERDTGGKEGKIFFACTVRKTQVTGYGLRNIDSKMKSLLKMKRQLQESQLELTTTSVEGSIQMLDLPDDCLYLIISYLSNPKDVLNLGETNS